jgi:hypothetical protein
VLDVLDGPPLMDLVPGLRCFEFVAHTLPDGTWETSYRLVLPLARRVTVADWLPFWMAADAALTGGKADAFRAGFVEFWRRPLGGKRVRVARNRGLWLSPSLLLETAAREGERDE